MTYFYKKTKTPLGELTLVSTESHLVAVLWDGDDPGRVKLPALRLDNAHPVLRETEKQLKEYFEKKRTSFDLPLRFQGTGFQTQTWKCLQQIPYGTTTSYGELGKKLGKPGASRAVGGANGKNPLSIVVPCHRVIGADGSLTGFAGGLKAKTYLLKLEGSLG